jgi:hypothetical protein
MPTHTEGRERNLPARTQIQSLRLPIPLDGASGVLAVGHSFMLLCPLLYLLWAVLTRLAGFAFQP